MGVEPTWLAWKARTLPLSYTRLRPAGFRRAGPPSPQVSQHMAPLRRGKPAKHADTRESLECYHRNENGQEGLLGVRIDRTRFICHLRFCNLVGNPDS